LHQVNRKNVPGCFKEALVILQNMISLHIYRPGTGNFFRILAKVGSQPKRRATYMILQCNRIYYNKIICHQTYTVLIRITMTVFAYLKRQKNNWKMGKGPHVSLGPPVAHPCYRIIDYSKLL